MVAVTDFTQLPATNELEQYKGETLTEAQVEEIFDKYDHDGASP